jgi:2-polyprenyl-3-methyl-5-hydroxy-6-metoxy-1,4-benzoquinol methylase
MKEFWDSRYSVETYAYGVEPNVFLKTVLPQYEPKTILFPAEGEGRNAVFAAELGWKVSAFDQSSEAKKKALKLAEKRGVTIDYAVCDIQDVPYKNEQFDALVLIYVHLPAALKSKFSKQLSSYLKKDGFVIIEAFSKNNLPFVMGNPKVGGPRDVEMLCSKEEILQDFADFEIIQLEEVITELNEGEFHVGSGSVIRFVGRKN